MELYLVENIFVCGEIPADRPADEASPVEDGCEELVMVSFSDAAGGELSSQSSLWLLVSVCFSGEELAIFLSFTIL